MIVLKITFFIFIFTIILCLLYLYADKYKYEHTIAYYIFVVFDKINNLINAPECFLKRFIWLTGLVVSLLFYKHWTTDIFSLILMLVFGCYFVGCVIVILPLTFASRKFNIQDFLTRFAEHKLTEEDIKYFLDYTWFSKNETRKEKIINIIDSDNPIK